MTSPRAEYGTLHLMPVWLGEHGGPELLPAENAAVAARITRWFCEDERSARRALRRLQPSIDVGALELIRLDRDTTPQEAARMAALLSDGRDSAIISEAGMPGIADPGALLVRAAHALGIRVVPLTGPSSLLLALAASGLNGQRFTFHGYLPVKSPERRAALKRLEQDALRTGSAQLFIETPYRNDALLADLLRECSPGTLLTLAIDLTQPGGSVATRTVREWQRLEPVIGKRPTVFIIGAEPR